ncbi:uncharacterized protein MONOS_16041 [Monocercomonoides exilis]|uniref:uncharacterized protein n=1 Tax=Monocercomonoides exilis TaxID=2049356 RepID=UPI003559C818|nr:hypothetical protein MONOS_16041 [Monocercomonoides exilis]|eukprot:MONOS_16041.1-p1 / transcript=MONOS_16041.1 / gene=MONOS_16041 / organism=Monocercomonoides_exilis_PA203 / gene_product=unspecified product / transcript_product=unspecified product / location=Mono_scaffold01471:4599-5724(+) / protein_length=322 / sequence_SO=supercontig / SO=protein_coding / is_pseudo=false
MEFRCFHVRYGNYGGYVVVLLETFSVLRVVPLPTLAEPVGTNSLSKRIFAEADVNALTSIYDQNKCRGEGADGTAGGDEEEDRAQQGGVVSVDCAQKLVVLGMHVALLSSLSPLCVRSKLLGGEDKRRGSKSGIIERSEKNEAVANGGGINDICGGEGGVEATVLLKINKMEEETKMLLELSKVQELTIIEQKAQFKYLIEKQQTALAQKENEKNKKKVLYEEIVGRQAGQAKEVEEQVLRGDIGGGREGGAEEKGGRGRDGMGRRRRSNRSGGGEYEEAEEGDMAEERDASAVLGIPLSLHEDAKREQEDWMLTATLTVE